MPSCTVTMQLCRLGMPSISTRHSKHAPIMQYGARGAPDTGVARKRWTPAASNAAATERPPGTLSGWSLNQIWMAVSASASVPGAGWSTLNSGLEVIAECRCSRGVARHASETLKRLMNMAGRVIGGEETAAPECGEFVGDRTACYPGCDAHGMCCRQRHTAVTGHDE